MIGTQTYIENIEDAIATSNSNEKIQFFAKDGFDPTFVKSSDQHLTIISLLVLDPKH